MIARPGLLLRAAATTALLAAVVSCSPAIDGTAVYAPDSSRPDANPVRPAVLPSLVLPITDLGRLLGLSDLTRTAAPAVAALPAGILDDSSCGSLMRAGWLPTYAHSGHVGADGFTADDPHEDQVTETVAAFRDVTLARAFVHTVITQWKSCMERPILQTAEGMKVNFMGFGPSRADGVDTALVRREGGRGFACSRAIAAAGNVTADATVCGPDETVISGQAAQVVNAILARIPA